jgi:uncharacterized damage-inducible protein DinB
MNQMDLVRETIRHNSWATSRLIEHLQSVPLGTLELTAEGTYGPIGATLAHLVRAEGAYVSHLRGEMPHPRTLAADLVEIGAEARRLAQEWEHLLEVGIDPAAEVQTIRGTQSAGTVLAQAINHGAEHRAHVCTVLGAHGLDPPALDAFAYREARNTI